MRIQKLIPAAMIAAVFTASSLVAAPIVAIFESPDTAPGIPQSVSSSDLVDDISPALLSETSSGHTSFSGSSPDVLNDGSPGGSPDGGWNLNANEGAVTTQSTPWTLTYMLDTSIAPQGYNLTQIEAMSLWTNDYVNQHYSVSVTTISNPTFTGLINDVIADTMNGQAASSLKSVITDSSGILASHVTGIQFEFETGSNGTMAAYKEIDVFGYAAVPEPTTCLLVLFGCSTLALRSRK